MWDNDWQTEIRLSQQRAKKARRILGVSESAGPEEIKRAWRLQSLKHHPDQNAGSAESHLRFILVNCAYEFLVKGAGCKELDLENPLDEEMTDGEDRLGNPWGYFLWWRENYFDY